MNKYRTIALHIIFCLLFLSLPFIDRPMDHQENLGQLLGDVNFIRDILGYILSLTFFYLNYFVLIPRLYFKKQYGIFILISILYYLVCTTIPNMVDFFYVKGGVFPQDSNEPYFYVNHLAHNFLRFTLLYFIALLLKINERLIQTQKEKRDAEYAYLKSQINPHFLFNVLNNIYLLAIKKSDKTPEAIAELSDMMRYVLSESNEELIPLQQEIDYISNYINLQKKRFGNTLEVGYQINGIAADKYIAPLLLIPFVENTFKHGVNPEEHSKIDIEININDSELKLVAINNKINIPNNKGIRSGIGIENTKARLGFIYPQRHKLTIADTGKEYVVSLTLKLS